MKDGTAINGVCQIPWLFGTPIEAGRLSQ